MRGRQAPGQQNEGAAGVLPAGQVRVVLPKAGGQSASWRQGDLQLGGVEMAAPGRCFGVDDAVAGGHQVDLARAIHRSWPRLSRCSTSPSISQVKVCRQVGMGAHVHAAAGAKSTGPAWSESTRRPPCGAGGWVGRGGRSCAFRPVGGAGLDRFDRASATAPGVQAGRWTRTPVSSLYIERVAIFSSCMLLVGEFAFEDDLPVMSLPASGFTVGVEGRNRRDTGEGIGLRVATTMRTGDRGARAQPGEDQAVGGGAALPPPTSQGSSACQVWLRVVGEADEVGRVVRTAVTAGTGHDGSQVGSPPDGAVSL